MSHVSLRPNGPRGCHPGRRSRVFRDTIPGCQVVSPTRKWSVLMLIKLNKAGGADPRECLGKLDAPTAAPSHAANALGLASAAGKASLLIAAEVAPPASSTTRCTSSPSRGRLKINCIGRTKAARVWLLTNCRRTVPGAHPRPASQLMVSDMKGIVRLRRANLRA